MPFCSQCGSQAGDKDLFCASCGARQPVAASVAAEGITPRTASLLCYIPFLGWIPAIIILASGRFRQDLAVRFHAFQGIYLFVAWLIVDRVIAPMGVVHMAMRPAAFWPNPLAFVGVLLRLAMFACWIFILFKTSEGVKYKLPLLGELAERSVAEQK
jgi:uncharacterized membrane protein